METNVTLKISLVNGLIMDLLNWKNIYLKKFERALILNKCLIRIYGKIKLKRGHKGL